MAGSAMKRNRYGCSPKLEGVSTRLSSRVRSWAPVIFRAGSNTLVA